MKNPYARFVSGLRPKCGEVLEEYGEYPYRKNEKGNTVCSAVCRWGCNSKYKFIIIEEASE